MDDSRPYSDTVAVIAAYFGVSDQTVHNWLRNTDIPHRRIGSVIRFRLADVEAWAAARTLEDRPSKGDAA